MSSAQIVTDGKNRYTKVSLKTESIPIKDIFVVSVAVRMTWKTMSQSIKTTIKEENP
jgi:hypothetical protein